ncbi:MAG: ATP-dependent zinc metalloprotease FtsH, partial [Elusimicrobia bacterium]|nr:ATP-dependent zinc metalloprotease FtsH [Elusimicrobiota bacterium]
MTITRAATRTTAAFISLSLALTAPGLGATSAMAQTIGQATVSGVVVPVSGVAVGVQSGPSLMMSGPSKLSTVSGLSLTRAIVPAAALGAAARAGRTAAAEGSSKKPLAMSAIAPALAETVFQPIQAAIPDPRALATGGSDDSYGQGRRLQEAVEGISSRGSSFVPEPQGPGGVRGWLSSAARRFGLSPALRADAPATPITVNKRISELRSLVARDPAAGREAALKILKDSSDRLEIRLTAMRFMTAPTPAEADAILGVAKDTKDGWYIRREATKLLGRLSEELKPRAEEVIAALKTARKDGNHSLHLMAGWALKQYGQDAGADRPFLTSDSGRPALVGQLKQNHQMPEPAKPVSMGKVMGGFIALLFGLALWSTFAANGPAVNMPAKAPTQIEQTVGDTAKKAQAPAEIKAEAPKDPIERIEQNTRKQAEAMERIAKVVDKANAPSGPLDKILSLVGALFFPLLIMGALFFMMRKGGGAGAMSIGKAKIKPTKSDVKFKDVAGIDDAKAEVTEIIEFLQNPARFRRVGAKMPKGALLVGGPGGGKTLLVKAVAGETGSNIFSMSGSEFVEMFVGVGAARARDLFEQARANAPAIIFIDEIDAVGKKRASGSGMSGGHDEREQTLNQILVEMDGFDNSSGVIVFAATNRPDTLDPALLRPGRFDRQIHVPKPDVLGREAILAIHSENVPLGPDVDLQHIARRSTGLTGAFLANIVNESAMQAARRNALELTKNDFDEGADRATIGASNYKALSDEQKKWTAYHEAGHSMVRLRGKKPQIINKLTIVPKGDKALGFAEMGSDEDVLNYTKSELEQMIAVAMGGLVAEEMLFGEHSTGPSSDLQQATRIAR